MEYLFAQVKTIDNLVQTIITEAINPLIRLLFAIAFAIFIWGIVTYVIGTRGDEEKIKQGKKVILWGLIGIFIMASAWGIIKLFCDFFGTGCP